MITIEELLKIAEKKHASDVHVTAGIPPKCRINGELVSIGEEKLTPSDTQTMVVGLLNDQLKRKIDKRGDVDFACSLPDIGRFRVNVFRQRGCFAMAIRLFPDVIPQPQSLGTPDTVIELVHKKRGLVLVTGPTGSGKSTTLAALISELNQTENEHVITIEDPIEYLYNHDKAMINQREIGIDTVSFTEGIKAALKENPDVIFISNLASLEEINLAIAAADTGHLVFASMPTVGVVNTLERLIDVFPPHHQPQIRIQLGNVLESIISQQLLPDINAKGRIAAFEILHNNSQVRELIKSGKINQMEGVMSSNRKKGMQTMDDAVYDLYLKRHITKEVLAKYSKKPAI